MMIINFVILYLTQLSLTLPWDLDARAPAKRPAGRLSSKPAASVSTMKTMKAGALPVRDKSNGTGTAAQLRAMKQIMKALREQGSNSSAKLSKALKSSKAKHKVLPPEPEELEETCGMEEGDEDDDDFTPDHVVEPEPPVKTTKLRFFDALARGASKHFTNMSAKLVAGLGLQVVHFLQDGTTDVEALYYVHDAKEQEDGLLVEASFIGASGKAHADYQDIRRGSNHIIHLCNSGGGCRSLVVKACSMSCSGLLSTGRK